jgi:hypothetical protein
MTADPCTCGHGRTSHLKRAEGGFGACMHRQDEHPRACPCRLYDVPLPLGGYLPGGPPPPSTKAVITGEWLNGRLATDWEAAALADARKCERDRDREQLAGVLSGDQRRVPDRPPKGRARPLTDIDMEWLS